MINRELVETLLGTLNQYASELRAEQGVAFEAFQNEATNLLQEVTRKQWQY